MKILSKLYADIFYDNTTSGLTADTIKAALDELNLKKVDINVLSSNLILYPTTVDSDIAGYKKMVSSPNDEDYDTTAVNIPTGAITTEDQLLSTLVSEPGLIVGNPGVFNVNTVGRIRKTDGNANRLATFYYTIYKRTAEGTETLLATSDNTTPVSSASYVEFNASALLTGVNFELTDRIVIKYYGSYVNNSGGTFEFEFGGNRPVRTLLPVPISAIPAADASNIAINTSNFSGVLSASDTTLQTALETLDAIDAADIPYDNSNTQLIAANIQQAIDALYQLLFPAIAQFDGGAPDTDNFVYVLDGGDPESTQDRAVDGGDPQGPTVDGGES